MEISLKKNKVALDYVNFGEEDKAKTEKLEAMVAAVNNNDSSHIVHVPAGSNALSDVLLRFVIVRLHTNLLHVIVLADIVNVFVSTPIFTCDGESGSGFAVAAAAGVYLVLISVLIPIWTLNLLLLFVRQWKRIVRQ